MTDKELISELRSIADKRRKGNRFDSLEYAAADRIEKLVQERDAMLRVVTDNHVALQRAEAAEAKQADALDDAQKADAHAKDLEADRRNTYIALQLITRLHSEVEAKLGRAEMLLYDAMVQLEDGKIKTRRNRARLIREFLDEIRGETK